MITLDKSTALPLSTHLMNRSRRNHSLLFFPSASPQCAWTIVSMVRAASRASAATNSAWAAVLSLGM